MSRGINLGLKLEQHSGGLYQLEVNTSTIELLGKNLLFGISQHWPTLIPIHSPPPRRPTPLERRGGLPHPQAKELGPAHSGVLNSGRGSREGGQKAAVVNQSQQPALCLH